MGAGVRPIIPVPDEDEFQKWKAKQQPETHDEADFQAWKAKQGKPRSPLDSFAAQSTAVAPNQAERRSEQSHRPLLESIDLPFGAQRDLNAAAQGATFGFSDELAGALRSMLGDKYADAVKDERSGLAKFRGEHPVRSFFDELAGGAATTGGIGGTAKGATTAAKIIHGAKTGAAVGAVSGVGSAEGGIAERAKGGVKGAAFGAGLGGVLSGVGAGVGKKVGAGKASQGEAADLALAKSFERDGQSVDDVISSAKAFSDDKPAIVLDVAGKNTQRLGRATRTQPSKGSAQIDEALTNRAHGAEERTIDDVIQSTGLGRDNAFKTAEQLVEDQKAHAKPAYKKAYEAPPIADEDVLRALDIPEFKQAYERGRRIAKLEGVDLPDPGLPPKSPDIRDARGVLRSDLSKVSDADLDAEWTRLKEMNAKEDALHGAVKDSDYRFDYEELPRTEKYGKKGQEDLPDADGMVDAERLAADNKVVADYNKSIIVRAQRKKGMDRIQAEIRGRPMADEDSFDFGSNVPEQGRHPIPTQGLDYMKRGLDDLIEGKMASGAMGRTEARALRNKLAGLLEKVDTENPDYKTARATFAGDARLQDAYELGRNLFKMHPDEAALAMKGMSPGEIQMVRRGGTSVLGDRIESRAQMRDPGGIADKTLDRRRLRLLFGDDASFADFQKKLGEEAQMHRTRVGITGNSQTADKIAEFADMGGIPLDAIMHGMTGHPGGMIKSLAHSQLARQLQARIAGLNEKKADALAERMLKGTKGRDELVQMLEQIKATQANRGAKATARGTATVQRANRLVAPSSDVFNLSAPALPSATDSKKPLPPEVQRFLDSLK